jgi:hypothetical protein
MAMKITAEFDPKQLKALDRDLDKLLIGIGQELASVPKMAPMVDKVRRGMKENSMKFKNSDFWEDTKFAAEYHKIVDFDSPLMTTGQLVNDFIFYAGKPKISEIPKSNEFIIGAFTWANKERKRPTYKHVLNQLAIKEKRPEPYPGADKNSFLTSKELVKIIMKSPRYPIMDSIVTLYQTDIQLHMEKLINEAFAKKK